MDPVARLGQIGIARRDVDTPGCLHHGLRVLDRFLLHDALIFAIGHIENRNRIAPSISARGMQRHAVLRIWQLFTKG